MRLRYKPQARLCVKPGLRLGYKPLLQTGNQWNFTLFKVIKVRDQQCTNDRSTEFLKENYKFVKTQLTGAIQSHEHFDVNIFFELKRLIYESS